MDPVGTAALQPLTSHTDIIFKAGTTLIWIDVLGWWQFWNFMPAEWSRVADSHFRLPLMLPSCVFFAACFFACLTASFVVFSASFFSFSACFSAAYFALSSSFLFCSSLFFLFNSRVLSLLFFSSFSCKSAKHSAVLLLLSSCQLNVWMVFSLEILPKSWTQHCHYCCYLMGKAY